MFILDYVKLINGERDGEKIGSRRIRVPRRTKNRRKATVKIK